MQKGCDLPGCSYPVGECAEYCCDFDEHRMDVIGQNGPTGEHYAHVSLTIQDIMAVSNEVTFLNWINLKDDCYMSCSTIDTLVTFANALVKARDRKIKEVA